MGAEQSLLRFLRRIVPNDYDRINITGSSNQLHERSHNQRVDAERGGTFSRIPSEFEGVPDRINSDLLWNRQDLNNVPIYYPYIDNNDNDGTIDREFIHVELVSNCQEESEIQLEDSSIDNNCNVSEYNINTEISNTLSGLTRNLQPNVIMEEGQVFIPTL
ncbi:hypothetical protein GCK72_002056 [Caenorhabditis remanei]|uniref:Uncharacterized protein n=1 Tax=Caenorhabditis remanei TaxID=31234 RepID=A0A6A5HQQ6_CAERE|nr:hypothetical protein GCK72_002056 [Caenorhabditis remanei]KAF1770238.1 hypothetical protein GCK72_002056 [Caenorhabditis remanei]